MLCLLLAIFDGGGSSGVATSMGFPFSSRGTTCEGRTNMPWFGSHYIQSNGIQSNKNRCREGLTSKYTTPLRQPLFLPLGSSRINPIHFPGANEVLPTKATTPCTSFPVTSTRRPIFRTSDISGFSYRFVWVLTKISATFSVLVVLHN